MKRFLCVFFSHGSQFSRQHSNGNESRRQIGDGAGVHDAVNPQEARKDDDQRQEKQDLPRQSQKRSLGRLSNGREERGRHGLYVIDEREEQINAEIPLRKGEVHLGTVAEEADNLPRENLKSKKSYYCDSSCNRC